MSLEVEMVALSQLYHGQRERIEQLEQLLREYRQFVREGDDRNGAVVIVHPYAAIDSLEKRATELIGE